MEEIGREAGENEPRRSYESLSEFAKISQQKGKPYCCTYLVLAEGKSRISLERRYSCTIEKALMGKTMRLRNNGCGVCMRSIRSGRGDMVRDLLRGTMCVSLRKLSFEKADIFTRHFEPPQQLLKGFSGSGSQEKQTGFGVWKLQTLLTVPRDNASSGLV
ncbi:uncharacterized protein LOC127813699 [Diospyros lotus]|uniref:uncharacterized protein LOC127813699 n=1 Tax=Diospyros lotus TaxID=55363 RepID=UPI00224F7E49|nr:uncharacterized protein LOC127813699 [Diospyros lotus]